MAPPIHYFVIDLETTGTDPDHDRIIEIGLVGFDLDGEEVWSWSSLVDPQRPIPDRIVELTGIDPEELDGAPTFAQLAPVLRETLHGARVAAHHAPFDQSFVEAEYLRAGERRPLCEWLCVCALARLKIAQGKLPSTSAGLASVCETLGIVRPRAHRALDDARAAGAVLRALTGRWTWAS